MIFADFKSCLFHLAQLWSAAEHLLPPPHPTPTTTALLFLQLPVEEQGLGLGRPNPALQQVASPLTLSVFICKVETATVIHLTIVRWGLKQSK